MPFSPRPSFAAIAVSVCAIATALAMAGTAGAAPAGAEFDIDLQSASGARVASLVGSVGRSGSGFATTVPLAGARTLGMVRGENFRLRRNADGSISARGGLGSRLMIAVATGRQSAEAAGVLARATRGRRVAPVAGTGVSRTSAYRPAKGDVVIVMGSTGGPIRAALGRRYRLVSYSASRDSRAALLANPNRYARVAGILFGPRISASQIMGTNLARTFHNSGRFVAASGTPYALDRVLSPAHFSRLGRQPVVVRRATIALGASGHTRVQVRGPIYADVRAGRSGGAGRTGLGRPTLDAFNRASARRLNANLAAAEALTDGPRARRGHEMGTTSSTPTPPTLSATQTGLSYYSVQINQPIFAQISVPGALSFAGCGTSAAPTAQGQWAFSSPCPASTQTQTVEVDLTPLYTVSLVESNSEVASQSVNEASYTQVSSVSVGTGAMAAGTYDTTSQTVTPATWGALSQGESGFGLQWAQQYSSVQEAGLVLAQGVHQVLATCPSCTSTSGGSGATVAYTQQDSAPTQSVTQVSGGQSTSTNWDSTNSATSEWNVSANLGAFGSTPTGGISGGYSSSTSTSTSTGGGVTTSVDYTYSNWTTSPYATVAQAGGQQSPLVQYQTYSNQIPGASGQQAPAAQGVAYPASASGNQSGLISAPAQYGGQNGPGPGCSGLQSCAWSPAAAGVSSWPQPFGFGSFQNATGYAGASSTFFTVFGQGGTGQLAIGSVAPYAVDNLQFADQAIGTPTYTSTPTGVATAWTQLQILNQQSVQIATTAGGGSDTPTYQGTGIGSGITTYYDAQGAPVSNQEAGGYSTTGLDLCAPPVLTQQLWDSGCATNTSLQGTNPPANYSGAPPSITAPGATTSNGNLQVPPGTTLTCNPGTWSGAPTGYAYSWQQWNATFSIWQTISGATGATYTAPTTSGVAIECGVTATNSVGSASAYSPSALVVPTTVG